MLNRLAAGALFAAACTTVSAQNVLPNGSFETPGVGLIPFADWELFGNVEPGSFLMDIAAQDGVEYVKLFGASNGDQSDNVVESAPFAVTPGNKYNISGFGYENSADPLGPENVILLQLAFFDASDLAISSTDVTLLEPGVSSQDQWLFAESGDLTAPANAVQARVFLLHIQLGAMQGFPTQGGGASFFDNIQVVQNTDVPCQPADNAAPFGELNIFDVLGYLALFDQGCNSFPDQTQIGTVDEDFETLDLADPDALGNTGWVVGANVFDSSGVNFLYNYFTFPAPNIAGPAFSSLTTMQGGPNQGDQQLSVYNDYNNLDHQNGSGNRIEAFVFQERTVNAADVGKTITFEFDYKRGNMELDSIGQAFIKVLDPAAGFIEMDGDRVLFDPMTTDQWQEDVQVSITITPAMQGKLFQFGFNSTASNGEGSGMFYDNLSLTGADPAPCGPADFAAPFGELNIFDVLDYLSQFDQGCPLP